MDTHFTASTYILLMMVYIHTSSSFALYNISTASRHENGSSELNSSIETPATVTRTMVTFPTFSVTGKPRIFSPLIHHLSSLLSGRSLQGTFSHDPQVRNDSEQSDNVTSPARDMFGTTLNHVR